jgi:signal transduction histidine kinase/CheY-like chemotaxis protein
MEAARPREIPDPEISRALAGDAVESSRESGPQAIEARAADHDARAFLLDASRVLAASLLYEETLAHLAALAVPRVADLCIIELVGDDGTSAVVEVAHADEGVRNRVFALFREGASDAARASARVLESGVSELWDVATAGGPEQGLDAHTRVFVELALGSMIILPMVARERRLGVLTLARAGTAAASARLGAADVKMGEDLAERTAMAVANGRDYLRAKNAVQTREDLLGIVSHDLRNPLNVTLMKCAMILRYAPENQENARLRRDIDMIDRSTRRMDRLLRDLQDFSSIQTGHLAIERRPESVVELLSETAESARVLAGKRPISIEIAGISTALSVVCDRERVLQVCTNLVANALKYTPETGSVAFEVRHLGKDLVFSVRDTGIGIDAKELPHVFQKYWRASSGTRGGVGLGLFISRALVAEHGGRLWATSEKGAGSTFSFSLPVGETPDSIDERRILIVDDDADLRRELGEVLSADGHPVAFAADGRQALSYLRSHPRPSLVLVDLMMPVMDGWEFCATVQNDPALAGVPIVVLSCLDRPEMKDAGQGVKGFLRKPIALDRLLALALSAKAERAKGFAATEPPPPRQ